MDRRDCYVDASRAVLALLALRQSCSRIGRAVGCDTGTVRCWQFGQPINATRRQRWVLRLAAFAFAVGMDHVHDNEPLGRVRKFAAEEAIRSAIELLVASAPTRRHDHPEQAA